MHKLQIYTSKKIDPISMYMMSKDQSQSFHRNLNKRGVRQAHCSDRMCNKKVTEFKKVISIYVDFIDTYVF